MNDKEAVYRAEDAVYDAPKDTRQVDNVEIQGGDQPYVTPRQQGTGATRGTQTISGLLQVQNPTTGKIIGKMGYDPNGF